MLPHTLPALPSAVCSLLIRSIWLMQLLSARAVEWLRSDDDRSLLFNPIGNYKELVQVLAAVVKVRRKIHHLVYLVQAAVKNGPTELALAHMAPILHTLLQQFSQKAVHREEDCI